MTKFLLSLLTAATSVTANPAFAAEADCEVKARNMKLVSGAKASFLKKCERDATPSVCETEASAKQLSGSIKSDFMKSCIAIEINKSKK